MKLSLFFCKCYIGKLVFAGASEPVHVNQTKLSSGDSQSRMDFGSG